MLLGVVEANGFELEASTVRPTRCRNPERSRGASAEENMVGANGFEPSTSWSRTRRASQAALRPDRLPLEEGTAARAHTKE